MEKIYKILQRIEYNTLLSVKQILNFDDAMFLTGLSKSHLYKLTSARMIPYYKPTGKQIYFDRSEIEAWLKRGRVDTIEEIEEQAVGYLVTGKMKGGNHEN